MTAHSLCIFFKACSGQGCTLYLKSLVGDQRRWCVLVLLMAVMTGLITDLQGHCVKRGAGCPIMFPIACKGNASANDTFTTLIGDLLSSRLPLLRLQQGL